MSDIEREAFKSWLLEEQGLTAEWDEKRNLFNPFPAHLAWRAWRAARQAPASGEAEPVAYLVECDGLRWAYAEIREAKAQAMRLDADVTDLYTHPPAKVPEGYIETIRDAANELADFDIGTEDLVPALFAIAERLTTPTPATTPETESCEWREDEGIWSGECGVSWWFEDGTPKENKQNFCPNCGKPCVQHEPQEQRA